MNETIQGNSRELISIYRYGVCGFPDGRRTMPFTGSVYQTLERRLGINPEFKKIIMGTTSRAVRFSVEEGFGDEKFRPSVCKCFLPTLLTLLRSCLV